MKKWVSLALLLVLVLFAGTALAASGEQGKTGVTVTFTVNSSEGVTAIFGFGYADNALEFVSATGGTTNPSTGSGNFTFGDGTNAINKKVGSVTFNIKKDASPATYSFTPNKVSCIDKNGDAAEFTVSFETITVTACSHTSGTWVTKPENAATCTEEGLSEYVCNQCDKVTSTKALPATHPDTGHDLVEIPAVEADCVTPGKTAGANCTQCAYKVTQSVVEALGHNYKNGVCERCGAHDPSVGFNFTINGSKATINSYTGGKSSVNVPVTLGGATVTTIDSGAFKGTITDVYLTKSITSIGDNAFPTGTKIHCYNPSYAYTWATDHGYTVVQLNAAVEITVPTDVYMDLNTTQASPFTVVPAGDHPGTTYTSDHPQIVTVDKTGGKLTAVAEGDAKITLTIDSVSKSTTVHVRVRPESFELNKTSVILMVNETVNLSAINIKPSGAALRLTWASDDATYASVSTNGQVKAKTVGDAVITATDMGGFFATCTVHIIPAITKVEFEKTAYTGEVTQTVQTKALVTAGDEVLENKMVTFTSSDTSVATVDANGLVTCISAGTADIIAKSSNSKTGMTKVTVIAHVHTPVVTKEARSATCTEDGWTEEKKCETCDTVLTASTPVAALGHNPQPPVKENHTPATCAAEGRYDEVVYCGRCNEKQSSTPKTEAVLPHTWKNVTYQAATCAEEGHTAGKYCEVCFEVDTPSTRIEKLAHTESPVAAVAPTYTTEGKNAGVECSVCHEILSGCETLAKLTRPDPTAVTLNLTTPQVLKPSDTLTLTATVAPTEAKPELTWTSSKPDVATVDASGKVTALAQGVTTITVTTVNGKKATLEVSVTDPLSAAYIHLTDGDEKIVHEGDFTLAYTLEPTTATNTVTFFSSTPSVVKVGADGTTLTVTGSGTATVTAKTDNNKTTTIKIVVHKLTITPAVAPTCTADGSTEGKKCAVASCTLYTEVVPAPVPAAHKGEAIPAVAATCLAPAMTAGVKCSVCKEILIVPAISGPALGHNLIADAAVAPTCTEKGKTAGEHCDRCGLVTVKQEDVAALGHTPAAPVIENHQDATCLMVGGEDTVIYCSVASCHAEMSRTHTIINMLDHVEVIIPGKAATETTEGLTEGIMCKECLTVLKEQVVIPVIGSRKPGDVNDDGAVNALDVLRLQQYLAGWGVSINLSNSDVTGDGAVNTLDAMRLMQYLAGWAVELK